MLLFQVSSEFHICTKSNLLLHKYNLLNRYRTHDCMVAPDLPLGSRLGMLTHSLYIVQLLCSCSSTGGSKSYRIRISRLSHTGTGAYRNASGHHQATLGVSVSYLVVFVEWTSFAANFGSQGLDPCFAWMRQSFICNFLACLHVTDLSYCWYQLSLVLSCWSPCSCGIDLH